MNPLPIAIHPIDNYTFGSKAAKHDKDATVRALRMKEKYCAEGMRRTVECVLLVANHGHPHVLLLQIGGPNDVSFRLPGGRLRPGEGDLDGVRRKLSTKLAPPHEQDVDVHHARWQVDENALAVWWRPNFEPHMYPYVPAHVTKPKECRKVFAIRLPEKMVFAVPRNLKLLAVPLFDLFDNAARYGPLISSIPHLASRLEFTYAGSVANPLPPPAPDGDEAAAGDTGGA